MNKEEQEAELFLKSLEPTPQIKNPPTTNLSTEETDSKALRSNQRIIDGANKILMDRLDSQDSSLQVKDIVSMKSDAFKQNQVIKWMDPDELDYKKIIPSVINIQVINNNG